MGISLKNPDKFYELNARRIFKLSWNPSSKIESG
jgi:hypothetical protein